MLACWVVAVTGVACAILLYTNVIYLKNLFFVRFGADHAGNVSQHDEALGDVDPHKTVPVLEIDAGKDEMKDFHVNM